LSPLPLNSWHGAKPTSSRKKQTGYSIVTVKLPQGNLTGDQMRGLARLSEQTGDGSLRFTMNQNAVLAYVPLNALKRAYGALKELGLADSGADDISDVTTCPGAYSCNLGADQGHGSGRGHLRDRARRCRSASAAPENQRQRLPQFLRSALDRRHRIFTAMPARSTARKSLII